MTASREVDEDPLLVGAPIVAVDVPALRAAFISEATALASFVRRAPGLDVAVPGLRWTAAEVLAHLTVTHTSMARSFSGSDVAGEWALIPGLERLPPPSSLGKRIAAINELLLSLNQKMSPEGAVEVYQESITRLVDAFDSLPDPDAVCDAPWLGGSRPASTLLSYVVTETLVHGQDIARALRRRLPLHRSAGTIAVPRLVTTFLPHMVRPERIARDDLFFDFRFRGSDARFTLRLDHGTATCLPFEPRRHDAMITIDPTALLFVVFGRHTLASEVFLGRSWGWGRRAYRTLTLPGLFEIP